MRISLKGPEGEKIEVKLLFERSEGKERELNQWTRRGLIDVILSTAATTTSRQLSNCESSLFFNFHLSTSRILNSLNNFSGFIAAYFAASRRRRANRERYGFQCDSLTASLVPFTFSNSEFTHQLFRISRRTLRV
jgi:hypothetical protein